jgi:hypothetical protein
MSSVSIGNIVCDDPVLHALTANGTATDASKVTADLHWIDGQTGLPASAPLMVMATGGTTWTTSFTINPNNSGYFVKAKLNDGTDPPPTDQKSVPPC